MTMPHLMNCPHRGDGWCLTCVAQMHDELDAMKAKARSVPEAPDAHEPLPGVKLWNETEMGASDKAWGAFVVVDGEQVAWWTSLGTFNESFVGRGTVPRRVWNPAHKLSDLAAFAEKVRAEREQAKGEQKVDPARPLGDGSVSLYQTSKQYADDPQMGCHVYVDDSRVAYLDATGAMVRPLGSSLGDIFPRTIWNPAHRKFDFAAFRDLVRAERKAATEAKGDAPKAPEPRVGAHRWLKKRTKFGRFTLQEYLGDGKCSDVPSVEAK